MSRWTLARADSLRWLETLPAGDLDAVVCDPPYSSGGQFRGDRAGPTTVSKYVKTENRGDYVDFAGDTRDQRGFLAWSSLWLAEAWRASREGALVAVFCDWRQLPTVTDAVQAGGWVWRGVLPWVKVPGGYRPGSGFANRCEYVVWGTRGPCGYAPSMTGLVECASPRLGRGDGKEHPTQKPVELMAALLGPLRPDSLVCDPFAGSGATGIAALRLGHRFVGCEMSEHYHEVASRRLGEASGVLPAGPGLFGGAA